MSIFTWESLQSYVLIAARSIAIAIIGLYTARYAKKRILQNTTTAANEALRLQLLARIINYAILAITALMVTREVGIDAATLVGLFGVIGISCGLAVKTSLANIFSGIFLMIEHPYEIGDTITFEGTQGIVTDSNLYATVLKTTDNKVVRIPHDKLIKNSIIIEKKKH